MSGKVNEKWIYNSISTETGAKEVNALKYSEILSKRITSLCSERNITYNKLADMSGLGSSTIDNILKGRHDLTNIRTLHGLATGFSMTTAEFLNFTEMNEAQFKGK